MVKGDICSA